MARHRRPRKAAALGGGIPPLLGEAEWVERQFLEDLASHRPAAVSAAFGNTRRAVHNAFGNTRRAVHNYHSQTPVLRDFLMYVEFSFETARSHSETSFWVN